MKTKTRKRPSKEFVLGVLCALLVVSIYGATSHDRGGPSGRIHEASQDLVDQTATFTTDKWDLAESKTLIMTANFTKVAGDAPTVDCVIMSGRDKVLGDTTGTSFTQAKAATKETKTIVDGKFHRFIWATCTMGGTITTVDVAFRVTGKP